MVSGAKKRLKAFVGTDTRDFYRPYASLFLTVRQSLWQNRQKRRGKQSVQVNWCFQQCHSAHHVFPKHVVASLYTLEIIKSNNKSGKPILSPLSVFSAGFCLVTMALILSHKMKNNNVLSFGGAFQTRDVRKSRFCFLGSDSSLERRQMSEMSPLPSASRQEAEEKICIMLIFYGFARQ